MVLLPYLQSERICKRMKKLLSLLPLLVVVSCITYEVTPINPDDAFFNSRGCLECDDYPAGASFEIDGVTYKVANELILADAIIRGKDLTKYCTSKITNMSGLFRFEQFDFNQDISSWDVSNVCCMNNMFRGVTSFNQDISNWDVSNVGWMDDMFKDAPDFNQDIGICDVSNVTQMEGMFNGATAFNQDLTQWCVSNFDSIPQDFSTNSALTESNHPVWGTCP